MIDITPNDFEREVLKCDIPVLVDFWATSCGPCKGVATALEAIEKERVGKLKVVKANVQEHPEFASRFQVVSVPTLVIFSGGKMMGKHVGAGAKTTLAKKIDQILKD